MASRRPKLIFHVAGHDFHPVYQQVRAMVEWLGPDYLWHRAESLAAFEHLDECDLLVFVGMYYTGWEGRYRPPGDVHKRALERYVEQGRPMVFWHGAIASYDDWPRFAELGRFWWKRRSPCFLAPGMYPMRVSGEIHPVTTGINDYVLFDAPPFDVQVSAEMQSTVHVRTVCSDAELPMVITGRGGGVPTAGKSAFIGHGHDMRSFESPAVRQLWLNTVRWCLSAD